MTDRPEDLWLIGLASDVCEGRAVDWSQAQSMTTNPEVDAIVRGLKRLAGVVDAHRSITEQEPRADDADVGSSEGLASSRAARRCRRRRVRNSLSGMGCAARARGGAQAPLDIARSIAADRGAASRPHPSPQRRHRLRRGADRPAGRHLDGVHRGRNAGRSGGAARTDERARGGGHGHRPVPGTVGAARRRTSSPRREGTERDARGRRAHRADGLQRLGRARSARVGPRDVGYAALHGAGAARGTPGVGRHGYLQRRRPALLSPVRVPADRGCVGVGRAEGAPRRQAHAAARSASGAPRHGRADRRARSGRRPGGAVRQRRRTRARARRNAWIRGVRPGEDRRSDPRTATPRARSVRDVLAADVPGGRDRRRSWP